MRAGPAITHTHSLRHTHTAAIGVARCYRPCVALFSLFFQLDYQLLSRFRFRGISIPSRLGDSVSSCSPNGENRAERTLSGVFSVNELSIAIGPRVCVSAWAVGSENAACEVCVLSRQWERCILRKNLKFYSIFQVKILWNGSIRCRTRCGRVFRKSKTKRKSQNEIQTEARNQVVYRRKEIIRHVRVVS